MVCKKPFTGRAIPFGCGQCTACRVKKRREWTHRIVLESLVANCSFFLTLTYNQESIPDGHTLEPTHVTLYLKQIRKACHPVKLRYVAVGEYGDETKRPHYHIALFSDGPIDIERVRKTWEHGHTHYGDITEQSARYISKYIVKGMTNGSDPRLGSRHPEFVRRSLKPGIGALAVKRIGDILTTDQGIRFIEKFGDVPHVLQYGKKTYPLGRYMRSKIREYLGHDPKTPQEILNEKAKELLVLYESKEHLARGLSPRSPQFRQAALYQANKQKILTLEVREKIFKSKEKL